MLVAGGGDGTVHEVVNGILASNEPGVVFMPLPLGSANDYAFTLGMVNWWNTRRGWNELQTMPVDVGLIRSGDLSCWFANCCGIGFNGMVTIEARKIRWLRGIPLYALAVIKALWRHYDTPQLTVTRDGHISETPTLAYTLGLGQREGGFPLTVRAKLDDGMLDLLQVGAISRWELIRNLPGMISGKLPRDHPNLTFGRGHQITIESPTPLCIHIDGEFFSVPSDNVRTLTIVVEPKKLIVAFDPLGLYGGKQFETLRSNSEGC